MIMDQVAMMMTEPSEVTTTKAPMTESPAYSITSASVIQTQENMRAFWGTLRELSLANCLGALPSLARP